MVNCKIWGAAWLWYQKISLPAWPAAASGNLVVTVNGLSSNPLPFTVTAGNIYFVSTAGSDNNPGSFRGAMGHPVECPQRHAARRYHLRHEWCVAIGRRWHRLGLRVPAFGRRTRQLVFGIRPAARDGGLSRRQRDHRQSHRRIAGFRPAHQRLSRQLCFRRDRLSRPGSGPAGSGS